jgi:hypothetical protein
VTYGGDSGNRIFVLYWRCPLIRVSVIRGSTVFMYCSVILLKIHILLKHVAALVLKRLSLALFYL